MCVAECGAFNMATRIVGEWRVAAGFVRNATSHACSPTLTVAGEETLQGVTYGTTFAVSVRGGPI